MIVPMIDNRTVRPHICGGLADLLLYNHMWRTKRELFFQISSTFAISDFLFLLTHSTAEHSMCCSTMESNVFWRSIHIEVVCLFDLGFLLFCNQRLPLFVNPQYSRAQQHDWNLFCRSILFFTSYYLNHFYNPVSKFEKK